MVLVVVVAALGWGGFQLLAPDEPERAASIVVVPTGSATKDQLNVIGPRIQGAAGVTDVEYLNTSHEFKAQPWDYTDYYLKAYGTPWPHWYSVTVGDEAAHEALENGGFAEDLLGLPGVAQVFFGCPDLATCAHRELSASDVPSGRPQSGAGARTTSLGDIGVHFKLWGEDTGGALAVVDNSFPVGALVTPHQHTRKDDYSIVTEGELGFRSGDREVVLG